MCVWKGSLLKVLAMEPKTLTKYERLQKGRFFGNRKDDLQKAKRTELNQNFTSKYLQYPGDWNKVSVV